MGDYEGQTFGLKDKIPSALYGQNLGLTQQKIYNIIMQYVSPSEQEQVKRKIDSLLGSNLKIKWWEKRL